MKKLLLGLMLLLSVGVFADGQFEYQEEMLENNFDINKKVLTDGNIKLGNIEYDLDIFKDGVMMKLDIEPSFGKGDSWEKFNKETFDKLMEEIVAEIRTELDNKTIPVTVSVEIEKKMSDSDEVVYNKTFKK
jgi:hypothetical protein